ncbi:MAG: hypothetical protein K2G89_03445 [Lachnospiraceae bacterium]|nr:hypothetical protein [Lachnospiraceae bacterium]
MEERKIFVPHELKTIEIDVEKKIFRVNGEDFGKNCTGFSVDCNTSRPDEKQYSVCVSIDTDIRFRANYNTDGEKTSGGFKNQQEKAAL